MLLNSKDDIMLRIFGILNVLQADDPADEEEPPDDLIPDVNQPLQNQEDNEDSDSNSDQIHIQKVIDNLLHTIKFKIK